MEGEKKEYQLLTIYGDFCVCIKFSELHRVIQAQMNKITHKKLFTTSDEMQTLISYLFALRDSSYNNNDLSLIS